MSEVIPVVLGAGPDRLLAHGDAPAWPAATSSDLAAVEQAAALAGLRVELVPATDAGEPAGRELVVGVGPATIDVSRLYAHLTGRRVAYADDVETAVTRSPVVIVAMESDLTVPALDLLAEQAALGQVIGVITGHDRRTLLLQALIRSVAMRAGGSAPVSRVSLFPMLAQPPRGDGEDGILDPKAPGPDVREALGRGAGVLTIMSHSDGVDANFGSLVLCPMDRVPAGADPQRLPQCRQLGTCHRSGGMAIDQWLAGPRVVAPEAVAARVLLYATCWGVLPSTSFDDNAWGLGRRLLSNPRIGALVTSWEAHWYNPDDLLAFARSMAAGLELGAALAQLLSTPSSRQTGLRMCLFGDPGVRLRQAAEPPEPRAASAPAALAHGTASAAAVSAPARVAAFDATAAAELAFLRLYVNLMAPAATDRALIDRALAAIGRHELARARGRPESHEDAEGERWRDSVLDALVWRGPLAIRTWMPLVRSLRTSPAVTACRHCQQRAITREYSLWYPGAATRRVVACARCGVVADAPAPRSIAISIRDGTVHLATDVLRGVWSARLAVYTRDERGARVSCEWPAAGDGWPARSIPMPTGIPDGTLDVAVYLLHGVSWYTARVPVRHAPDARRPSGAADRCP